MTDQPEKGDGVVRRILKNVAFVFGGKTSAVLFGLVILIMAAKTLTTQELGSLLLLHAFVAFVSGVASFKSWQALIKYGVDPIKRGDKEQFQKILRFTIGLDLVAAVFAALLSTVLFLIFHPYIGELSDYVQLGVAYCLLSITNLRSTPTGILRLFDRFDLVSLHDQAIPIVRFTGAAIGLYLGAGLEWFIMTWFFAALSSHIFMPLLALRELSRQGLLEGLFAKRPNLKAPETGLWSFVWMSNIDATIDLTEKQLPTLLSGGILGASFAAMFKIARDVSDVLAKGARLLDDVLYPELVRLILDAKISRALRLIIRSTLILLATGFGLAAIVYVSGPGVFEKLLTSELRGTSFVTTQLMVSAAFFAAAAPLYPALYALGEPGRATLVRGVTVISMLILFFALARLFGSSGPGLAMIIAHAFGFILAAYVTLSRLRHRRGAE